MRNLYACPALGGRGVCEASVLPVSGLRHKYKRYNIIATRKSHKRAGAPREDCRGPQERSYKSHFRISTGPLIQHFSVAGRGLYPKL
jgi:hypothetical protein